MSSACAEIRAAEEAAKVLAESGEHRGNQWKVLVAGWAAFGALFFGFPEVVRESMREAGLWLPFRALVLLLPALLLLNQLRTYRALSRAERKALLGDGEGAFREIAPLLTEDLAHPPPVRRVGRILLDWIRDENDAGRYASARRLAQAAAAFSEDAIPAARLHLEEGIAAAGLVRAGGRLGAGAGAGAGGRIEEARALLALARSGLSGGGRARAEAALATCPPRDKEERDSARQ